MIAPVHTGGASFKGVVDYCLSEGRAREDERDELRGEDRDQDKAGRVAWSETRNVAAEEQQREQGKKAWETSRPEREAAERARRAWIIENDPNFAEIPVRERQLMVDILDKRFPQPDGIESPAARENRIAELARRMKLGVVTLSTLISIW